MEPSKEAPKQFKQPSRKGKKAWRKNVDLTEVHDGLESVRQEIIQGGVISEKTNDALFAVDTVGDENIVKPYFKPSKKLKVDEILSARSAVPAVSTHKRGSESKTTDGILQYKKRKSGELVSSKKYDELRKIAYGGDAVYKDVVEVKPDAVYDAWAVEKSTQQPEKLSFLEPKRPLKVPSTMRQAPVSLAANGGEIPTINTPHPGQSYNPVFKDWDALIKVEGTKEVAAERRRLQEQENDRIIQELREAAQWDSDAGESTETEDFEETIMANGGEAFVKPKPKERKTKAERNKAIRRKELARQKVHDEKQKKFRAQQAQIAQISKALAAKYRANALARASESSTAGKPAVPGDDKELRRRPLGKHRPPEEYLELVLPDELKDSLRLLKPEGNLLRDRFRSVVVRGKVEARKLAQRKERKTKLTEKWTFKDFK